MTETRESKVIDTFVELADTLSSDYEVSELLRFLVERCADILGGDTAGVLLQTPDGHLRLAAATSAQMDEIEALEIELGQGPCMEAYTSGEQVLAHDLEERRDTWPEITPRILAIGMRSAYAFPLRLRDARIGALNLYRREPGPFHDEDIGLGQAFADVAAIGILQERELTRARERSDHLQHALDARVIIEQAKGVLAHQHGVSPGRAFEGIRAYARSANRTVRGVAQEIVDGVTSDIPV